MKLRLVLSLVALMPSQIHALTGEQLRNGLIAGARVEAGKASTAAEGMNAGHALGYTQGVIAALNNGSFCLPPNATADQTLATIKKFLDDNPAIWNEPAVAIIVVALKQSFPCQK